MTFDLGRELMHTLYFKCTQGEQILGFRLNRDKCIYPTGTMPEQLRATAFWVLRNTSVRLT